MYIPRSFSHWSGERSQVTDPTRTTRRPNDRHKPSAVISGYVTNNLSQQAWPETKKGNLFWRLYETSYEVAKWTLCFKDRTTGISFCSLFLSGSKLTCHFVIIIIISNSLRPYAIKIIEIIFVAERLERWDWTLEVPRSNPRSPFIIANCLHS